MYVCQHIMAETLNCHVPEHYSISAAANVGMYCRYSVFQYPDYISNGNMYDDYFI